MTDILSQYLAVHERFIANDSNSKSRDYPVDQVAKVIVGLLVELEKVDISLLKSVCDGMLESLTHFYYRNDDSHTIYKQLKTKSYVELLLVSSKTSLVRPIESESGGFTYQKESAELSEPTLRNFIHAIPDLQSPRHVYELPAQCDERTSSDVSDFHHIFSSTSHSDREKVLAAIYNGYKIEPDNSGLITSRQELAKYGLLNSLELCIIHNAKRLSNDPSFLPEPSPHNNLSVLGLSHGQSLLRIISYKSTQTIIDEARDIKTYLPKYAAKASADIEKSDTLDGAGDLAEKTLKRVLMELTKTKSQPTQSEALVIGVLNYALSVTQIMESLVKRFDSEVSLIMNAEQDNLPIDSSVLDCISELYFLLIKLRTVLDPVKDNNATRAALVSLGVDKYENISKAVHRLLNDDSLTYQKKAAIPAKLVITFMPNSFKADLIKRGLSADLALLVISNGNQLDLKAYPDTTSACDSVIDYLLEIERQHPGLIFESGDVNSNTCPSYGLSEFNDYFNDEIGLAHLNIKDNWDDTEFGVEFKKRLMHRITKEITLQGIHVFDSKVNDGPSADMGFLRPLQI